MVQFNHNSILTGRTHEIPKRLKLWKLSDYEEKLEPQEVVVKFIINCIMSVLLLYYREGLAKLKNAFI